MASNPKLARRGFMIKMTKLFTTAMIFPFPALAVLAAEDGLAADGNFFTPLGRRQLVDIAAKKLHHGPKGFVNPMAPAKEKRFWDVLSWKFLHANNYRKYLADQPFRPITIDWRPVMDHNGISVTFIKHAGLLIRVNQTTCLIDPVFDGIGWGLKDYTPLTFTPAPLPRPDHVLITHGHYDHLDKATLGQLEKTTHVITPLGHDAVFKDLGMANRTQLDWFQSYKTPDAEVILVPAHHWTMRNPLVGPNRSLWGGFIIRAAGGYTIYVSGDCAYFDGFEQLGRLYDIDLAIFNLGAYEPRWFMGQSHMNPAEVVRAFGELKARQLMIVHWGTFQLGDEPVHFPPLDLKPALEQAQKLERWISLQPGQTHYI